MNSLRPLISRLDRSVFPTFRWNRLRWTLSNSELEDGAKRDAVRLELRYQRQLWGDAATMPAWARLLVDEVATPAPVRSAPKVDEPRASSGRRGRAIEDTSAIVALVRHLDAHRWLPIRLVVRA